ncbi:MAG: GxxExxY protein [Candidatus Cloacimonetes bacterium]|nr:GxxExxY protein [Candidatus Cloacimonadota bacterium]
MWLKERTRIDLIFKEEFFKIKKACIEVRKNLGNGFLEKVYENALKIELELLGFNVKTQVRLNVTYKEEIIGEYCADIIVGDKIIIELKCASGITDVHKAQLLNYLKATDFKLGILINFPNDKLGFDIIRIPNFITTNE